MNAMDDPKLIETLTRMETKLDAFISTSSDHESRIRSIERKVWAIPSIATIIGVITLVIMYNSIPAKAVDLPSPKVSTSISQSR